MIDETAIQLEPDEPIVVGWFWHIPHAPDTTDNSYAVLQISAGGARVSVSLSHDQAETLAAELSPTLRRAIRRPNKRIESTP